MTKRVKVVSFVLALSTVLSLSSCGGKKEETASEKGKTVKWITAYTKPKDHSVVMEEINKKLSEKLGVTLDLNVIDSGAYGEKMNLMISSNEDFDICFTSNWLNPYAANVKKKAYLKLDDMLDKVPELKKIVPDYLWQSSKVGDGIFAIPNYQVMFRRIDAAFNPELVKKYNFDVSSVKELKDLEPYLKTIKDNEPDYIPFCPSWTPANFNYENIAGQIYGSTETEKFLTIYDIPEYREYLNLAHNWYQKGYIASDIMTNSDSTNNMYAVSLGTYKPGVEEAEMLKNGYIYDRAVLSDAYVTATTAQGTMNAVNSNSKDPETALKVIEAFYTDKDLFNILCFGVEGKHYEKIGDNQVKRIGEDYNFNSGWLFGNQFNAYLTENQAEDTWDKTIQMNDEAKKSPYLGFAFDIENVKNEVASVSAVQSEYENFLNYGVEDPAKHWDTYVEKLKNAGIEKILSEMNKQYEVYKKIK